MTTTDSDFEVVPDSLRRSDNHRGRATNPVVVALLEGKTVRARKIVDRGALKRRGFILHVYEDLDNGGFIMWASKEVE